MHIRCGQVMNALEKPLAAASCPTLHTLGSRRRRHRPRHCWSERPGRWRATAAQCCPIFSTSDASSASSSSVHGLCTMSGLTCGAVCARPGNCMCTPWTCAFEFLECPSPSPPPPRPPYLVPPALCTLLACSAGDVLRNNGPLVADGALPFEQQRVFLRRPRPLLSTAISRERVRQRMQTGAKVARGTGGLTRAADITALGSPPLATLPAELCATRGRHSRVFSCVRSRCAWRLSACVRIATAALHFLL
jgi:hypothetical protein